MNVRTPTGARWSCQTCGMGCHLNRLGPLEPGVVEGLVARRVEEHWPPAARQPWYREERAPDGTVGIFLAHTDGHCVFLRPDNLCAIHALFGPEAKPGFCREYPITVVEDPDGLAVIARSDCGGLHSSFEDGQPLDEQVSDALALPRVYPRRRWAPREVLALPDLRVATAVWMGWERTLLEDLDLSRDDPPSPEAMVAALRARLHDLAGVAEPEPDPVRYVVALRAAIEGLHRTVAAGIEAAPPGASAWERAFMEEGLARLGRARERLATDWSTLDAPLAPEARRYLNLTLRGHLLGKQVHALGGVAEGLGAWLLDAAIARAGLQPADGEIGVDELGAALSRWRKLSFNGVIQHVLRLARPALADAFQHATA